MLIKVKNLKLYRTKHTIETCVSIAQYSTGSKWFQFQINKITEVIMHVGKIDEHLYEIK